ncbi:MAG: DUF4126 domain-containing protein, partial [Catalinimonas sp.]
MDPIETIAGVVVGLGLAASAGFRIFVPLLLVSTAGYFGVLPVGESWGWLASLPAVMLLGVATLLETGAYFIPWFDNLLDTVAVPTASLAGVLVMASTMVELDPVWRWALAIIAGGGTAGLIGAATAGTRLASTAATGGLANPIFAAGETIFSAILSVISVFLWPLAPVLLVVICVLFYRRRRRRRAARAA